MAYPDGCTRGETVFDPRTGDVIVQVPPLSEEKLYPKEKALVDLVAAERLEGRRVLVYVTHTGTRDITGRMDDFLTRHGFKVAVMKADAVAPNRREKWVADKVKEGIDVLICHPRLVQTGLDLIDFPTIVWDETDYSVYVVRQASRRSWRIGQTRPVKVVFMSYRNTLQADALKLVAKKMQSSLAVEGELPEDGLAAYGDDGDDMMMALARRIVSGDEEDTETMEEVFAQARNAESEAEELLVDDGWKVVEIEPEKISVNGNGNGNGHHDPFDIGPTVELVPANGHALPRSTGTATATTTKPRRRSSRCSPGRSSWPRSRSSSKRNRKPQARKSLSMFEWAMEQEREEGAGRRGALDRKFNEEGPPQTERRPPPQTATQRIAFTHKGDQLMARIFVYDDREFPDPDPQMSVDQVKATLSDFYGEIANASVKETKRGDDTIYEFQRRVGTKGAFTHARS